MDPAAPGGPRAGWRQRQWPADASGFVGRTAELAFLAGRLAATRLITVTGPGGVGKTRLALRAAVETSGHFPDGNVLVELSALTEPRLLPNTVAQSLGLAEKDSRDRLTAVVDYLRGKRLLLVLDTCEHLTRACARFAAQLLRETADVTILATSRQPLHVADEQVIWLGPLPVPGTAEDRSHGDAVELFAQRAAAALPGFRVTAANEEDVIQLCRRLDGMPLAIELAAIRVRALSPSDLTDRVAARFSLLTGTRRGTVPRHQTLRAAIDWSYGLCAPVERAVWNRLSVFAGTFDPVLAREVAACSRITPAQVDVALAGLIDKSVVLPAGEQRYRLLDSVREFAAVRLASSGEEVDTRRRHVIRYLALARDFGRNVIASDQRDRLGLLRSEHANIRAALEYGFASTGGEWAGQRTAARLAGVLFPYWRLSGALREGIYWQDRTLAEFAATSAVRAAALVNRALLGALVGKPEAVAQSRAAIAMAAEVGDTRTQARGYLALHLALTVAGCYRESLTAAVQARELLTAVDASTALRCLEAQIGLSHQLAGKFGAAVEHCGRALDGLGSRECWLHGTVQIISALALYQQGEQAACSGAATAALRASGEIGDVVGEAYALEIFGWLAADEGRCGRAAALLGAAAARWQRCGGRLSGNPLLEGYHERSAKLVAGTLGAERYARLHGYGEAQSAARMLALAAADGDVVAVAEQSAPDGQRPGRQGQHDSDAEGLTSREREIAAHVAGGLSNREVAQRLSISKRTVDAHVNHIFAKLGLSSRVQLTGWLRDRARAESTELSPAAPRY
jgi:predicted ATPase/DNA-binding CsgD family transcriptional regulator